MDGPRGLQIFSPPARSHRGSNLRPHGGGKLLQSRVRPWQLHDELLFQLFAPRVLMKEALQKPHVVHVAMHDGGVALVDAGEVIDLVGVEFHDQFGNPETIGAGVAQHAGRTVERLLQHRGPTPAAELARGSPFGAPEAPDFAPDGLTAFRAKIPRLPVDRLGMGADFANGARHLFVSLWGRISSCIRLSASLRQRLKSPPQETPSPIAAACARAPKEGPFPLMKAT